MVELRLILKTSSVTPNFFYAFYRILSFSTVSQSFKKNLCVGSFWARTSLCCAAVILAFHHCTGSQQSASRGRVLAFYRIAPCLSSLLTTRSPTSFPGATPLSKWRTDAENNRRTQAKITAVQKSSQYSVFLYYFITLCHQHK